MTTDVDTLRSFEELKEMIIGYEPHGFHVARPNDMSDEHFLQYLTAVGLSAKCDHQHKGIALWLVRLKQ